MTPTTTKTDRYAEITDQLIAGVKAVQSSADFVKVLEWQAAFHTYSIRNVFLIFGQRPDATYVAGYTRWQRLGRQVRKGAKGIKILAPRIRKAETEHDEPTVWFGIEHVFDISDTDGEAVPTYGAPKLEGEGNAAAYAQLVGFAQAEGLTLVETPEMATTAEGYYNHRTQTVYITPNGSPAHRLRVLAHELAHYLDQDRKVSREERETVAEGAAHVFCAHYGLDTSANTYPYIAGWAQKEGGEKTILACLERIQRIAKTLIQVAAPPVAEEAAAEAMAA